MRWSIFENIIELYLLAGKTVGLKTGREKHLGWILNKPGYWPNSVIGLPPETEYLSIIQKIEKGLLPPFLTLPTDTAQNHLPLFRQHYMREVLRWEGMFLLKENFYPYLEKPENYIIKQVSNIQGLNDWTSVVLPVMLPNKSFPEKLLNGFVSSPKLQLLTGYFNNQPVASGMAFTIRNVSGIYFIATLPEHRGNGYASAIVSKLICNCFEKGVKEVILHASDAGKYIYLNLGFEAAGGMSTFWKVGR
ncbi:MAG: GNAT family N-acetyltransferase [Prolixibacteraceae bacterium]|nr:GNAT family N-acetyltransferase [Prolixibacteraceae bacterium]